MIEGELRIEACREAAEDSKLKRATDEESETPFSPYNLWLYRQTYYGIRTGDTQPNEDDLVEAVERLG